ncbi:hypothetical protein M0R45_034685 [Rubus argutus]|uniref:AT-hook motif nuclear-localized protein n=1 Tax=Rubus argutus TaxID=59490 RepID=A0AAW1VW95_RUBAR
MPMVMERSDGSGSAHGSRRERGAGGALGFVMARRRRGLAWLVLSVIIAAEKMRCSKSTSVWVLNLGRMNMIEAMVTLILELCLLVSGLFQILSFSGCFMPLGDKSWSGGMSVSLAGADGRVRGGGNGLLTAPPVQVVVCSFLPNDLKGKGKNTMPPPPPPPTDTVARPPPTSTTGESEVSMPKHGHQIISGLGWLSMQDPKSYIYMLPWSLKISDADVVDRMCLSLSLKLSVVVIR